MTENHSLRKKHLKGEGISIKESLIRFRMKKKVKKHEKIRFKSCLNSRCLYHAGKEIVLLFVLFVLLFILRVLFFWGNFATCFFFRFNDKWEHGFNTNIFISDFKFYYVSTQSYFFSYNNHGIIKVCIIVPRNNIRHTLFTDSRNKLFSFILIIVVLLASIYDA